jgi:AcrR family transcriptional regulator
MTRRPGTTPTRPTARLSRDVIVATAIAIADRDGLDGVSMRRLGQELGVNPMSLYHHVADKDALVDAMADAVVAQITPDPTPEGDEHAWAVELRRLVFRARRTMLLHPWAVPALQQRSAPSAAMLGHVDRVLGILRRGGCSVPLRHHAMHVLGSQILGFAQGLYNDAPDVRADPAVLAAQFRVWAATMPDVVELGRAATHDGALGGCDDDAEFAFTLDLVLEGLERRRVAEAQTADR